MAARDGVGLSPADLDRLREQLAAGAKPRVRLSGPQFADQATGTVLAIGRPETDGEDFVTVRVKAGGVTDELRFAPRELAAVRRGTRLPIAGQPARAARRPSKAEDTPVADKAASTRKPAPAPRAAPTESVAGPRPSAPDQQVSRPGKAAGTARDGRRGAEAMPPAKAVAAGPARRRGASLPAVSVSLTSTGATWAVSARRGSRTVVKSAPVPPGVVSAVAELLALPGLSEAVAAVNDAALQEAEARAAELRAELAALEAELDSHRRP